MFSSLSKPFVVAWYDTSEAYLLVFGLLLLVALYAEFLAEPSDKKLPASRKQKRMFEESESLQWPTEPDSFFKRYKRFFGILVVVSVFGELLADGGIFAFGKRLQIISDRENSIMAGVAAQAKKEAGQANERAAITESNNLVLQAKLQPRIITPKQVSDFLFLTEKIPKFPIRVSVGDANNESYQFAIQIRRMLNKAGYEVPDSDTNSLNGIFPIPNMVSWSDVFTDKWTDIVFFVKTNVSSLILFHCEKTNSFLRPIPESGEVCAGIFSAFDQSEIGARVSTTPEWVGTSEMSIFIRQRPH